MPFDLYTEVTNQVIAMLDKGVIPWRSPILRGKDGGGGLPQNLESAKPYRGINVFLLAFTGWMKGYSSSYWLTFHQAKAHGGSIRKGEKSSMVIFWKPLELTNTETGEKREIPMLRYYNVFNIDQCSGIAAPGVEENDAKPFHPIDAAEVLVKGYAGAPVIEHGGQQAFYRPSTDSVSLPEPGRFTSGEDYYATLYHELAHSTGHSSRLNRGLDSTPQPFGSADYGKEELVAEMAAAYLCGHAGIRPAVIENQAAYISGWLAKLHHDKKLIITAAGAAQKAADWICGQRGESH